MAQTFPNSPSTGTVYTVNNTSWKYDGSGWIRTTLSTAIPGQTGNSGKYLTTDGSNISWATVTALPSQTGNSGKYLTTDGTTSSWATVTALPSQTGNSGKYLITDGTTSSWSTVTSIPKITSILITDNSYTVLDDTAVSTAGGYIKIIGTGFTAGSQVLIGTVVATSVSFISSTELRAQVPATGAGTYVVYVVATDGSVAIRVNGITFSATPTWSTGSSLGTSGAAISIQLAAVSDTTITYSLAAGSTLPTGLSLSSSGLLSGTVTGVTVDTVYNFTITATDLELQDSPRSFSITITTKDAYFPYVSLLLNTTSTNIATNNTFLDSSTNNFTIARTGTPTQGSITPYWTSGQWSNYFNGSSSLQISNNAAFNFGTGDFTVEFWIYCTIAWSSMSNPGIAGQKLDDTTNGWQIYKNGGNSFMTIRLALQNDYAATSGPATNTWEHWAAVRNGTTLTWYKNGTSAGSYSGVSTNISDSSGSFYSGFTQTWNGNFTGYISNLRIVKGVAVYTGAFTPPTALLATTQSAGTNIAAITTGTATSLLTCQSNRFKDNSSNNFTFTVNSTPQTQPVHPFSPTASYTTAAYGGSGYFSGSGDYLTVGTAAADVLGSGNFTFEAWAYRTASANGTVAGKWSASNGWVAWILSNVWTWTGSSGNVTLTGTSNIPLYTWTHLVVCRSGNNWGLFVNGIREATTTSATAPANSGSIALQIAGFENGNSVFPGYISNLRIVKGTSFYDPTLTTLTVPTAPVTAIANTSVLADFTNAGIYSAAVQNAVTTVGDAQVSTAIYKWPPTSMKFDGTGDWLTAIDNPQHQIGSGDFTIEGWFYLAANGVAYGIISKGAASTGWSVNVTSGNRLQFSYTASNLTGATTTLAATTWYYFAVVRSGGATGNLKIYINGTLEATSGGAVTDNFNQTNTLYVGADRVGSSALNGYLQDIRLTKGVARTVTTTPTAAFQTQ